MAMADGYAQASGKLAVVNLHVTPGLGNAMGMLYDAQKAASPILVTAGQHDQNFNRTEPILCADLPPIARPLVKWSAEVHRIEDLPRWCIAPAKTALAPPTGPVFLSLPGDILKHEADLDLMAPTRVAPHTRGDRAAIEAAAELLAAAEAPGDHGGRRGGAEPRARRAGRARRADRRAGLCRADRQHGVVPLLASAVPRRDDALADRDAQDLRPARRAVLGRRRPVHAVAAVRHGADSPDLRMIHLDTDPWELGKNYPAEVAILGDPKATLPELTEAMRATMPAAAQSAAKDRQDRERGDQERSSRS